MHRHSRRCRVDPPKWGARSFACLASLWLEMVVFCAVAVSSCDWKSRIKFGGAHMYIMSWVLPQQWATPSAAAAAGQNYEKDSVWHNWLTDWMVGPSGRFRSKDGGSVGREKMLGVSSCVVGRSRTKIDFMVEFESQGVTVGGGGRSQFGNGVQCGQLSPVC